MQATRQQISLCCTKDGQPITLEIDALVCGGLAIHKSIGRGKGYTLTHIKSGVSLACSIRLPVALQKQALEEIASLMDWARSFDEIVSIWLHDEAKKNTISERLRRLHS